MVWQVYGPLSLGRFMISQIKHNTHNYCRNACKTKKRSLYIKVCKLCPPFEALKTSRLCNIRQQQERRGKHKILQAAAFQQIQNKTTNRKYEK